MDKYDASMVSVLHKSSILATIAICTNTLGPIAVILCYHFDAIDGDVEERKPQTQGQRPSQLIYVRLLIASVDIYINFIIVLLSDAVFDKLYFCLCGCLQRNLCTKPSEKCVDATHQSHNTVTFTSKNGTISARIEPYHGDSNQSPSILAFTPLKRPSNASTATDLSDLDRDDLSGYPAFARNLRLIAHSEMASGTVSPFHTNHSSLALGTPRLSLPEDPGLEVILEDGGGGRRGGVDHHHQS